jgi:hypothetical protein
MSATVSGTQLAGGCDDACGNQRLESLLRGPLFSALERTLVRREQFPACEWNSIRAGLAVFRRVSHFLWRGLLAEPCQPIEYLLPSLGSQLGKAANYLHCASGSWVQMLRSEAALAWFTLQG